MNRLEPLLTTGFYLTGLAAIGGGVACAVSAAWAAVVIGSILLGTVFASRLRMGGRKE